MIRKILITLYCIINYFIRCVINRFSSLLDMCVEVLHDVTDVSTSGGEIEYVTPHYISNVCV